MNSEKTSETVQVAKESIEALAENIQKIAECAQKMMNSGLKEETIILLLHDHSRVGKRDIKEVLHSLQRLGYYRK